MAIHLITIQQARPGRYDVRLGDDQRLFVESTAQPFMESAQALLASGLALPTDEIEMRFGGGQWVIRRGRIKDAVKTAVGRPPMRLIQGRALVAGRSKTHQRPPYEAMDAGVIVLHCAVAARLPTINLSASLARWALAKGAGALLHPCCASVATGVGRAPRPGGPLPGEALPCGSPIARRPHPGKDSPAWAVLFLPRRVPGTGRGR
jgi:hypothetical protein